MPSTSGLLCALSCSVTSPLTQGYHHHHHHHHRRHPHPHVHKYILSVREEQTRHAWNNLDHIIIFIITFITIIIFIFIHIREEQAKHAWNNRDRSLNIFVKEDCVFTFHRSVKLSFFFPAKKTFIRLVSQRRFQLSICINFSKLSMTCLLSGTLDHSRKKVGTWEPG